MSADLRVLAFWDELEKIGSSLGHWRRLDPGQRGNDQYGNEIHGKTWVAAGAATAGAAGFGLSAASEKAVIKTSKPVKKVRIYYTDPTRGSGHLIQGKALREAFIRKGFSRDDVELINFDREFTDDKARKAYVAAFKRHYGGGQAGGTKASLISSWLRMYHGPGLKSQKLKAQMTADGVLPVLANPSLGWTAQRHGVQNAVIMHTDQMPWGGTDPNLSLGRSMRHVASEGALSHLLAETPSLRGRVRSVPDLPIMPLSSKEMVDSVTGKPIKMNGKYNITISGGGLGLSTDQMLESVLRTKLPKGTVVHVVTGGIRQPDGTILPNPAFRKAKQVAAGARVEVRVYGWSPLRQMMEKADLNILRPHGTSITEATAAGKPFILSVPPNSRVAKVKGLEGIEALAKLDGRKSVANALQTVSVTGQQFAYAGDHLADSVQKVINNPEPFKAAVEKRAPLAAESADRMADALLRFDSWRALPNATKARGALVLATVGASLLGVGWLASQDGVRKEIEKEVELTEQNIPSSAKIGMGVFGAGLIALGAISAARGKRLRSVEGLIPKVTVTDAARFQKILEPGDLILQQMRKGNRGPLHPKRLRNFIFRSSQSEMIHTAVYLGGGKIAHITPRSGKSVIEPLSQITKSGSEVMAIRPKGSPGMRREAARIASESPGKYRYDTSTSVKTELANFLPKSLREEVTKLDRGKVICTSMSADIYRKAGMKLPKNPGSMLTVDFRALDNPPEVRLIGTERRLYIPKTQGLGFVLAGSVSMLPAVAEHVKTSAASPMTVNPSTVQAFWGELEKIGFGGEPEHAPRPPS